MKHFEVRTRAARFIMNMPEFPNLDPQCGITIRKVAFRLLHSGIYKTHTVEPLEISAPGLIKLALTMREKELASES